MVKQKLLVVIDDEENVLLAVRQCLRKLNIKKVFFNCPEKALDYIKANKPDMVISDQRMPNMLGTQLFSKIQQECPDVIKILLSAYNDFNDVAHAFNNNTIQKYLSKPWDNKELVHLVKQSLLIDEPSEVANDNSFCTTNFHGMLSRDKSMEKTFQQIRKASTSNIPIFITGDTGTGKELAAKACHLESSRRDGKFIAVNCANFSDSLMESQLFGHVKGAFTGAVGSQQGLLSAANGGTLFLDEITCLPLPLQAKLLRVLQEREFCAIGSNKLQSFEAQVITASSVRLSDAVHNGKFREDLFYRLNVITIEIPKLRDRAEDVVFLAEHFLEKFSEFCEKKFSGFSKEAKKHLVSYHWPGNVRQLENLVHSLVVLNEGDVITGKDLLDKLTDYRQSKPSNNFADKAEKDLSEVRPLWVSEKEIIQRTIGIYKGNIPKASAALEVSPSTIYRKIQSWKTDLYESP